MNDIKWVCIFKTNKIAEAELIKNNLEHSGIPCVIFNKQDRSYLAFGSIEINVPEEQKMAAMLVMNEGKNIGE